MARRDPLLGLLLALFGLVALGAAVLAIMNATSGRVLLQLRGSRRCCKTLGFTPGADHWDARGRARGPRPGRDRGRPGGGPHAERRAAGRRARRAGRSHARARRLGRADRRRHGLAVVLATAVPGWRAGRVWPVAAVRPPPPRGHLSRLAAGRDGVRLPPAIVLGARAAFVRRLPAALTIGGLAIPMLMITIGLGFWSTLDDVQQHPADIGLAAALTVSPGAAERRSGLASGRHRSPGGSGVPVREGDCACCRARPPRSRRWAWAPRDVPTRSRSLRAGSTVRPSEAVATQGLLDVAICESGTSSGCRSAASR